MNRRNFLESFAAAMLTSKVMKGKRVASSLLTIGDSHGEPIAEDFVGLSYESAQLANPEFFQQRTSSLSDSFASLHRMAVFASAAAPASLLPIRTRNLPEPPPFEVFGPDTSKTVKHGTVTSAVALQNLRSFLDATN